MYSTNRFFRKNTCRIKKGKKGSVTPLLIGISFAFFVGLTFLTVEVPIQRANITRFNSFLTNVTTSAIKVGNENGVSRGEHPQIDDTSARKVVYESVEQNFFVKRNPSGVFELTEKSTLLKSPNVDYLVVNKPVNADDSWVKVVDFKGQKYKINSSSIFVHLDVVYKDFMLPTKGLPLKKTVVNQIKRNGDLSLE